MTVRPSDEAAELAAAMSLRERVFCGEQGVSRAEEFDGLDEASTQIVALEHGAVIATCRLRRTGDELKLERMAVEPRLRGAGVGGRLLAGAESAAREQGAERLYVHAQTRVRGFYAAAGYEPEGDLFMEAGIEHVRMSKTLGAGDPAGA